MKLPRFSIAGLMGLVLLVAVNFGAVRLFLDVPRFGMTLTEWIFIGGFPMANILLIGLLILRGSWSRGGSSWITLVGFEAGGTLAFLIFMGMTLVALEHVNRALLRLLDGLSPGLLKASVGGVVILLPQVALGVLGGWLARRRAVRGIDATRLSGFAQGEVDHAEP